MNRCKDIIANNEDVFDNYVALEEADSDVDEDDEDEDGEEEDGVARDFSRVCELARGDSSWYAFLRSSHSDVRRANSTVESCAALKTPLTAYIAEAIARDDDVTSLSIQTKFAHAVLCGCFEVTNDVFATRFGNVRENERFCRACALLRLRWAAGTNLSMPT